MQIVYITDIASPKEIKAINFKNGNIVFALQSAYYNIIKLFSNNLIILAEIYGILPSEDWNGSKWRIIRKVNIYCNLYLYSADPPRLFATSSENSTENKREMQRRQCRSPSGGPKMHFLSSWRIWHALRRGRSPCIHISQHVSVGYSNVHARTFFLSLAIR